MLKRKHQKSVLIYALVILLCAWVLWHRAGYPMFLEPLKQIQQQMHLLAA